MMGLGIQALVKNNAMKKVVIAGSICVLLLLSLRTMVRNSNFSDDLTLLSHDSKVLDNADIENNLGLDYEKMKNYPEALSHYSKSVQLQPSPENLTNIANMYEKQNDKETARKYLFQLLNLANTADIHIPDFTFTFAASQLVYYDSPENAKEFTTQALQFDPQGGYLWANLAVAEYRLHNQQAALAAAEKAKTLT